MPLSKKDLTDISKEMAITTKEAADTKSTLPDIDQQIADKNSQTERSYILYNRSQNEIVLPYEIEHRWLNGTTHPPITQQQINDAANRTATNIFFPTSWANNNALLTANGNGNPTSISSNSESYQINELVENGGLISTINLLVNGQPSGVPSDTLDIVYNPGDPTITVFNGGQTVGQLLYISGGTSALVRITGVSGVILNISEIIPPQSPMGIGSSVVQNIPGFSNASRQTLTSGPYQNILTQLSNKILNSVTFWGTALSNELAQLNINIDNLPQINTAKTNVQNTQTSLNTWSSLPNTGVSGKFTDSSIAIISSACSTRNPQITTRASQIVTNLGSLTQNSSGDYSGNGQYLQRFKFLNYIINGANGPQYLVNVITKARTDQANKVANNVDKIATYSNIVKYSSISKDANGSNQLTLSNAGVFSISESILITGNNLPTLEATIANISGNLVTFNVTIPVQYTKEAQCGVIKQI